jgi:hypothetical protein
LPVEHRNTIVARIGEKNLAYVKVAVAQGQIIRVRRDPRHHFWDALSVNAAKRARTKEVVAGALLRVSERYAASAAAMKLVAICQRWLCVWEDWYVSNKTHAPSSTCGGTSAGTVWDPVTGTNRGFIRAPSGRTAFLRQAAPDETGKLVEAINDLGVVVGSYDDGEGRTHGVTFARNTPTLFDYPGAVGTRLTGINDQGVSVGYWLDRAECHCPADADLVRRGFILRRGKVEPLDFAVAVVPLGINERGQIVGRYANEDGVRHGFLFERGTYRTLDFPGAADTVLTRINNRGVIVGTYDDFSRGLIAYPTPVR